MKKEMIRYEIDNKYHHVDKWDINEYCGYCYKKEK